MRGHARTSRVYFAIPIMRRLSGLPLAVLLGLCVFACGSKHSGALNAGLGSGDGTDDSSDDGGGATGFNNPQDGDDGGSFVNLPSDGGLGGGACAASSSKGEQQNLDVYIMLDQSLSMADDNKWTGVTGAINAFVQEPQTGVSVGLAYFALSLLNASCTPSDYATPVVEIAPLPGVASAITMSLSQHGPSTTTPTLGAEQGAIQHAQAWAKSHPGDVVAVILATDGDPDGCQLTPDPVTPVADAAMTGFTGSPSIPTFVIGVGTDTANLNQIAMGGGTGSAFIVDTSMNVNTQFLAALSKIRGTALGCQYKIPAPTGGQQVDFTKVNVQFTTSSGTKEVFPQVASKSACPASGDAWYYDNPQSPTQIDLCTTTCGAVSAGGTVNILTGCATIIK